MLQKKPNAIFSNSVLSLNLDYFIVNPPLYATYLVLENLKLGRINNKY